jgi:hypothetical protein
MRTSRICRRCHLDCLFGLLILNAKERVLSYRGTGSFEVEERGQEVDLRGLAGRHEYQALAERTVGRSLKITPPYLSNFTGGSYRSAS